MEKTTMFNRYWRLLVFSVRSPFLRFSCGSVLSVISVLSVSVLSVSPVLSVAPDVENRVDSLLARMTLDEKLGQLQQLDGLADGRFRPEHLELARRGLLGSTLNVRGARQGDDYSQPDRIVACAKHWVAYGAAEAGRDYNTVDISERTLRSIYFPPFKAAVDAGVGTLMSAFNDLNGVPASGNSFTLTDVLRGEWKFDGFVVSD